LKNAKPRRKNMTQTQKNASVALRNDPHVIILPADKGNATVVMSDQDYRNKMQTILNDPVYKKLKRSYQKNRKKDHSSHQEIRNTRGYC
jgi:PHD/YefM family antitoxin component YafN of YafNO toxin-antitoxin module